MIGEIDLRLSDAEFEGALIGCLLGDGHLGRHHGTGLPYLTFTHKEIHKPFVEFQISVFQPTLGGKLSPSLGLTNSLTLSYRWRSKTSLLLKEFEKDFYIKGNDGRRYKCIPRYAPKKLTPLGIYLLYMGDGNIKLTGCNRGNPYIRISTCCFKIGENLDLIDYLAYEWDAQAHLQYYGKYPMLFIGTKDTPKFLDIIRPYAGLVPCMQYKFGIKPSATKLEGENLITPN